MTDNKKNARLAGLFWFLFGIFGILSYMVADAKLIVEGDAVATISNINSNMILFSFGVAAFAIGYGIFIPLASFLRKIFKPVNNRLTIIMIVTS